MYVLYWVHFPTTCLESTCPQLNSLNTQKSMVKRPVGWPTVGHQCCSALVFQVQQEDLVSPQYSGRSYVWVPWVHGRRLLHQNSITLEVAYTKDLPFFVWNEKNKHRVYPSYLWHFTTLHPVLNVIPSSPLLVFVISVGIQTNKVRRSICLPCWLKFRESSSKDKKWANVCKDQCLLETLEHSTKIRNCALNIKRIFSMVRIPHWWLQMKRREIEFSAQSAKSGGVGKVQSQTCISFQMQGMNKLVEKYESEIFFFLLQYTKQR